ncbi:hypothetical protein PVIIG_06232 [Plasmodium vivax India VII]|uniref:Uncharacterized protein n=1 Tax=Plasmodium vivax India VII TaxID=1077284 RepID=A0A0J9SHI2_PLAVI|nr:hypothetical protein PVIIG_06232 [Plasmodium vivax India VII]
MEKACKYISYLLHKEVDNILELYYDEEKFKILYKFVEDYYKRLSSKPNDLCLQHIVYVNEDMYKKLDDIYRLYNNYTNVLPWNNKWNEDLCEKFKIFVNGYNYYINNNKPTSLKLNDILTHFEGKINNNIKGFGGTCTKYKYTLTPIVKYIKPEEDNTSHKRELEADSPPILSPQETNPQTLTRDDETHIKSPPTDHVTQEAKITQPNEGIYQAIKAEDTPVRENVEDTELHRRESYDFIRPRTFALNERMGQSEYPQTGLETDQGTMGKITGAITGVLREVEPGPILGVSGGMGALFLLFKVCIALKLYLYFYNKFK